MRKLIHFIIPGVLILIAAGVIIAILLSKRIPDNDSGVIGNTAGNLNSGGLFCETDGTRMTAFRISMLPVNSYTMSKETPNQMI